MKLASVTPYAAAAVMTLVLSAPTVDARQATPPAAAPAPLVLLNQQEGDFVLQNYRFRNGATLPEVKIHYTTVGTPIKDASGKIRNGVLLMHGSSNDARQLLVPSFLGPLIGPGQPLDATRNFLIFPDMLGNGRSSKPSDGLHAKFPNYGYQDMVDLEHRLVTEHLGISRLHLVMGISMGGMQTWMWGTTYPDAMDALVTLSSLPSKVDGRNLLWRRILTNGIRADPEWKNGEYTTPPSGYLHLMPMFNMMISSPARLAESLDTREKADAFIKDYIDRTAPTADANNILYRFEASFDYNPSADLEKISAPLLCLLFADDELNPPELGVVEKEMPRVKSGRYVMYPAGPKSVGHQTQAQAAVWVGEFTKFLATVPSAAMTAR